MSIDHESESPLTPLGLELLSTRKMSEVLNQTSRVMTPDAPAWLFLVWLIGPFLLADFLFGPVSYVMGAAMGGNSDVSKVLAGLMLATCMGFIPLQAVVLNCYAVFSTEPWWFRGGVLLAQLIPLSVMGIVGMYVAFLLDQFEVDVQSKENVARYFCSLPAIVLAGQLPFWFMRIFRGWQFVRIPSGIIEDNAPSQEPAGSQPLSILHLLVATAVVAMCLGLIRVAPLETLEGAWVLWVLLGVFSGIAFCFSLVGIFYVLLFTRIRSRLLFWNFALGVPVLIDAIVFVVLAFFVWELYWDEMGELGFNTLMFSIIGLTFILGLVVCLWLLRMHGWTIARARQQGA